MGRKVHWTEEQWIDYGNRVKELRNKLQSLGIEGQHVTTQRTIKLVFDAVDKIDKWKFLMEDEAFRDGVGEDILLYIFCGKVGSAEAKRAKRK